LNIFLIYVIIVIRYKKEMVFMARAPKEENKKLILTLPLKMHDDLQQIAERKGQTINSLLRLAAAEYIERENKN